MAPKGRAIPVFHHARMVVNAHSYLPGAGKPRELVSCCSRCEARPGLDHGLVAWANSAKVSKKASKNVLSVG